jgi:hypothetical protein
VLTGPKSKKFTKTLAVLLSSIKFIGGGLNKVLANNNSNSNSYSMNQKLICGLVAGPLFTIGSGIGLYHLFKKEEPIIIDSEKFLVLEIDKVLESFPCAEFKSELKNEKDKIKFKELKKEADKIKEIDAYLNNYLRKNEFKTHPIEEKLIAQIMIEKYEIPEIKSHIKWDFINKNYKYKSLLNNNAFVYLEVVGLHNYILQNFLNKENNDIADNLKKLVDLKNKTLKYKDNVCEETIVFNGENDSLTISHFEQNQKMWQLTLTKTKNIIC